MVQSLDVGTRNDDTKTVGAATTATKNGEPDTKNWEADTKNVDLWGVEPGSVQKTRGRIPTVSRKGQKAIAACILSIAVAVGVGVFIGFRMAHGDNNPLGVLLGDICGTTLYPETCNSTLYGADTSSPKSYVSKSLVVSMNTTNETLLNLTRCRDAWPSQTGMQFSTLQMCVDMYQDIIDAVGTSLYTVNWLSGDPGVAVVNDLEQRASAALTYHFTCINGLQEQGLWTSDCRAICGIDTERTTELLSNALSLVDRFTAVNDTAIAAPASRRRLLVTPEARSLDPVSQSSRRMLYGMDREENDERFPTWLSTRDRRLLQSNSNVTAHSVVALDGSGDFTSIQAAVDRAPSNSSVRYVIHIKKGTYHEQIDVRGDKLRLTFLGDGVGATIVSGNVSSRVNNVTTKFTATLTVSGDFFMAKNLTIRNTAGPDGHQAVALRVTSQQSAFTWLSVEGYQDTLYAHTSQQFYSYCTVYGTIDFVFGSAAAVFQNCSLLARLPTAGQTITYTASGINSSVVQKYTGLVFHACTVGATPELIQNGTAGQLVFLGRPWHAYARTVFIKSKLSALINPQGWILWNKNASSNGHVDYGEYDNFGPGSNFSHRVSWSKQLTPLAALDYGVDRFLKGAIWLPGMNVSYSGSI